MFVTAINIIAMFCTLSCDNKQTDDGSPLYEAALNGEKLSWDSISGYISMDRMIPVKATNDTHIADISKATLFGHHIYIKDRMGSSVFLADLETGEVTTFFTHQGKANNEYISISDIGLDNKENLYVYDSDSRKVLCYDKNGKHLFTNQASTGECIAVKKNGDYAIACNYFNADTCVAMYDKKGTPDGTIVNLEKRPPFLLSSMMNISSSDDGYFFTQLFDNTIYQIKDGKRRAFLRIDFGDKNINKEELFQMDSKEFLSSYLPHTDEVLSLDYPQKYKDLLFVRTYRDDNLLYDIKTNKLFSLSNLNNPYKMLFRTPVFLDSEGDFFVIIDDSTVRNALLPYIKAKGTNEPIFDSVLQTGDTPADYWILLGHVL